jgi:cell fate regulator YaaT (PSP1 superfamily)
MTSAKPSESSLPESGTDTSPTLDESILVFSSEENSAGTQTESGNGSHCCEHIGFSDKEVELFTEVSFKGERRGYYLNRTETELRPQQYVIVEAEKGTDIGQVGFVGTIAYLKSSSREKPCAQPLRKIVRLASDEDVKVLAFHREQEATAYDICLSKIQKLNIVMKLVDVEFQFDRNRITFYFTADGRVDFRELVRELAAEYRTRIELRQIGPRDEARRVGGFGVCGRQICCSWLGSFEPISTEMARMQNLSLNPFKLAGQCGRLKCCLAFEARLYEELLQRFPPLDYTIKTKKGTGKIEKIDIFQDAIYIHFPESDTWERMSLNQVQEYLTK